MKPSRDEPRVKTEPPSRPTRSGEALRAIEEYAAALREIIKKLRGRLNWGRLSWQPKDLNPEPPGTRGFGPAASYVTDEPTVLY